MFNSIMRYFVIVNANSIMIHAHRFQHGFEVQNKGVSRLSTLDTISTRGATTILDCMELEIVRIQIYRYCMYNKSRG